MGFLKDSVYDKFMSNKGKIEGAVPRSFMFDVISISFFFFFPKFDDQYLLSYRSRPTSPDVVPCRVQKIGRVQYDSAESYPPQRRPRRVQHQIQIYTQTWP